MTNVESKLHEVKVYNSMCTGDIPMKTEPPVHRLLTKKNKREKNIYLLKMSFTSNSAS